MRATGLRPGGDLRFSPLAAGRRRAAGNCLARQYTRVGAVPGRGQVQP